MHKAKKEKNDEFYTQLGDIEREMKYYRQHFENKTIFCNCDDPMESKFFLHFKLLFNFYKLKRLISTHYNKGGKSYSLEIIKGVNNTELMTDCEPIKFELQGDGDFRSDECIELMKQSDIVITNPPFSLFREFISLLIDNDKNFLVIGNQNAITYKEIFKLIKDNKLWLGYTTNKTMQFLVPEHYKSELRNDKNEKIINVPAISWYTNLSHNKRNEKLELYKKYTLDYYPKYDNYDAINVDKVCEIPENYSGIMGVPITFLNVYNKEQFEIVGHTHSADKSVEVEKIRKDVNKKHRAYINGVEKYARILIRNKEAK